MKDSNIYLKEIICYNNIQKSDINDLYLTEVLKYILNEKLGNLTNKEGLILINYFIKSLIFEIDENFVYDLSIGPKNPNIVDAYKTPNDYKIDIEVNKDLFDKLLNVKDEEFVNTSYEIYLNIIKQIYTYLIKHQNLVQMSDMEKYILSIETIANESNEVINDNSFKLGNNSYSFALFNLTAYRNLKLLLKSYNENLLTYLNKFDNNQNFNQKINLDNILDARNFRYFFDIDKIISKQLKENPKLLEVYPILELCYDNELNRKNIAKLIDERYVKLSENNNLNSINNLYYLIILYKHFSDNKEFQDEVKLLTDYMITNNDNDVFLCNLLSCRLKMTNASNDAKEKYYNFILSQIENTNVKKLVK